MAPHPLRRRLPVRAAIAGAAVALAGLAVTGCTRRADAPSTVPTRDGPSTAAEGIPFRSPAGGYRLTAAERIWEPLPAAGGADLELRGALRDRLRGPLRAEVRVWRKPAGTDPVAVARAEFTRDETVFGPTEFVAVTDEVPGEAPSTPVARFRVTDGGEGSGRVVRLVAVAGLTVGTEVIVAAAACPWAERDIWERRFVRLLGSLR
jgi:hypothetical protein